MNEDERYKNLTKLSESFTKILHEKYPEYSDYKVVFEPRKMHELVIEGKIGPKPIDEKFIKSSYVREAEIEFERQIAKCFDLSYYYDLNSEPPSDFWSEPYVQKKQEDQES